MNGFLFYQFSLLLIFCSVIFFSVGNVEAAKRTEVKGYIETDTIWTKDKSPYYMIGNVTLGDDVTLTIEPGTEVIFSDTYYPCELKVYGKLVVQGTDQEKVKFTTASGVRSSVTFPNVNNATFENWVTDMPININGSGNVQ